MTAVRGYHLSTMADLGDVDRASLRRRDARARLRAPRRAPRTTRRGGACRASTSRSGRPTPTASHVIGDFEGWGERPAPLARRGDSGIWEGFVPGVGKGTRYKYRIVSRHGGYRVDKADPYGFRCELPPATASIVWDLDYDWGDGAWMSERAARSNALDAPMSIYEVHLGSWMRVPEEEQPLAQLPRDRAQAGGARAALRLHARRADADRRAPVLPVVGLPGDRLLRADRRATARPRTSCGSSTTCTSRGSA